MQGELSEIDIRSILQLIELGQRTGELFIETYLPSGLTGTGTAVSQISARHPLRSLPATTRKSWFVFFAQGQLVYASDNRADTKRLRDYLYPYGEAASLESLSPVALDKANAPEYGQLWQLIEQGSISPHQGKRIVGGMIKEVLFDLLSLHQGLFIFETSPPLSPPLIQIKCSPLMGTIMLQRQAWKKLHPQVQSPDQRPVIDDHSPLRASLKPNTYKFLKQWTEQRASIRQLARYLNRSVLSVAQALYPYICQGIVQLLPVLEEAIAPLSLDASASGASPPSGASKSSDPADSLNPLHIVCIDDNRSSCEIVNTILTQHGYTITSLTDPLEALSKVFHLQPDLILCDIDMPCLDGYELCAMLRKSSAFRHVPMIMLTGKDGFIDRVKARIAGANDYLTKPFSDQELLTIIEQWLVPVTS